MNILENLESNGGTRRPVGSVGANKLTTIDGEKPGDGDVVKTTNR